MACGCVLGYQYVGAHEPAVCHRYTEVFYHHFSNVTEKKKTTTNFHVTKYFNIKNAWSKKTGGWLSCQVISF